MVDSAFGAKGKPHLIQSCDIGNAKLPGGATDAARGAWSLSDQVTQLQQAAEHRMRTIQGQFPWLKDNLSPEEQGEREITLHPMVLPSDAHQATQFQVT